MPAAFTEMADDEKEHPGDSSERDCSQGVAAISAIENDVFRGDDQDEKQSAESENHPPVLAGLQGAERQTNDHGGKRGQEEMRNGSARGEFRMGAEQPLCAGSSQCGSGNPHQGIDRQRQLQ